MVNETNSLCEVWKFGSRWSDFGSPESCIANSVFARYNIAFSYTHAVLDANAGDLIALANGWNIVAVGKILSEPGEIKDLPIRPSEEDQRDYFSDPNVCGCLVHYHWLNQEDQFAYCRTGRFCHAPQIKEKVNMLYRKYEDKRIKQ